MRVWSRRKFLGSAMAVACVGCGADEQTTATTDGERLPADTSASPVGGPVDVGQLDQLGDLVEEPLYVAGARAWLVGVTAAEADQLRGHLAAPLHEGLDHGLLALYEKCPHLGCRVPFCESSGWFECRCHGTKFTRVGEHREGPGPRGLDGLEVRVVDGRVSIERRTLVAGHDVGFVGVELAPRGPHCVDSTTG